VSERHGGRPGPGATAPEAQPAADESARGTTLAWTEDYVAQVRWGSGGRHQAPAKNGLGIARFRHFDSRANEPLPHDHWLVSVKVQRPTAPGATSTPGVCGTGRPKAAAMPETAARPRPLECRNDRFAGVIARVCPEMDGRRLAVALTAALTLAADSREDLITVP
jgi:hypothetical protein